MDDFLSLLTNKTGYKNPYIDPRILEANKVQPSQGLLGPGFSLTDIGNAFGQYGKNYGDLVGGTLENQKGREQQEAATNLQKYQMDQDAKERAAERAKEEYMQKVGLALPAQIQGAANIQALNQTNSGLQNVQNLGANQNWLQRNIIPESWQDKQKAMVANILPAAKAAGMDENAVKNLSIPKLTELSASLQTQNQMQGTSQQNQMKAYQKISGVKIPIPDQQKQQTKIMRFDAQGNPIA